MYGGGTRETCAGPTSSVVLLKRNTTTSTSVVWLPAAMFTATELRVPSLEFVQVWSTFWKRSVSHTASYLILQSTDQPLDRDGLEECTSATSWRTSKLTSANLGELSVAVVSAPLSGVPSPKVNATVGCAPGLQSRS